MTRIAHSQIFRMRHPECNNEFVTVMSRIRLPSSFLAQNSVFVFGNRKNRHPSWACQKHPCINMTVWYFFKTKSGQPGRHFWCILYRKPSEWSPFRIIISGFVFFGPIRDIISDRLMGAFLLVKLKTPLSADWFISNTRDDYTGNSLNDRNCYRVPELLVSLSIWNRYYKIFWKTHDSGALPWCQSSWISFIALRNQYFWSIFVISCR